MGTSSCRGFSVARELALRDAMPLRYRWRPVDRKSRRRVALRRYASGRAVKPAASPCRRAEGGPATFSVLLLLPPVVTVRNECESSRGEGCFLIARSFMLCYHLDAEHE